MAKKSFKILLEFSIPLIAGVVVALIWANSAPESYAHMAHWSPFPDGPGGEPSHHTLHFLVNDIFMALFFGIAAGEIKESCLPGGALNPPRKAINPLLATVGGIAGPIAVYLGYVQLTGAHEIAMGWGVPTATDIAIAWLVARAALGKKHPGVSFLLLLAVADDGIGLGIIAVFYPDPAHPVQPIFLLVVAAAMLTAYGLKRSGVKNFWPYLIGPGAMSWFGLHFAHLHPALALCAVIPFMPAMAHDEGLFADESAHNDTLNRFQHSFKTPVDLGLFAFGLVNAGVILSSIGAATTAVLLALIVGKTVGIVGMSMLGQALGFPMPTGMTVKSLLIVGICSAVGLTVALFVSNVAFTDPALQGAAKMGALLSVLAAPLAIGLSRVLNARELAGKHQERSSTAPDGRTVPSIAPGA